CCTKKTAFWVRRTPNPELLVRLKPDTTTADGYSDRSAASGSMRAARRAGMYAANSTTATTTGTIERYVIESAAVPGKARCVSPPTATLATTPNTTPTTEGSTPWRRI